MGLVVFFVLSALLVIAAVGVVANRHPVRSAMCLVATLFLLAVHFVLLRADFVAILQVLVYAGAIMVLFLFVIMLLNLQDDQPQRHRRAWQLTAVFTASLFALGVVALLRDSRRLAGPGAEMPLPESFGSIESVALRLFTHYLLPFEITSLLMLAAVIGAVVLARKKAD